MEVRTLPCKLTDAQLKERAHKLAEQVRRLSAIKSESKDAAAQFRLSIADLEEEMSEVAQEIRDQAEMREVEVVIEKDFEEGVETTMRKDTGEIVNTRVLGPNERQGEFRLLHPGAEAEAAE